MNNNLVKFPIRFGTLLLAGAALVSCTKETFTEKQAFDLEAQRLRLQRSIDSLSRVQAKQDRLGLIKWQRALDSLDALNAGGRVFYTVIPVDASTAIFAQGGGRAEKAEAIATATVTVSQYGRTYTLTGDNNLGAGSNIDGQARNGVFTFADLRSGEVTVNIKGGANYTEVSYVSNLTPDGGVANNGTVYVGNVIPLFNVQADATRNGIVKGRAHYEGDLTNAVEEPVTQAILDNGNPTGARSPLVSAQIDVTRSSSPAALPYFHERFLVESNDEGVNSFGTPTRSGRIQRIAYESATTNNLANSGTLGANGSYAMIVPASAVGLPTILRFAEFATQRTHYRMEQGRTVVANERYLYGPNVTPSAVPLGAMRPTISIQTFQTVATVTATFTNQTTGDATVARELVGGADTRVAERGLYLSAPTVTLATGTGATFGIDAANFVAVAGYPASSFFQVNRVTTATNGTFTANQALNFTRTDVFPNAGTYVAQAGSGAGAGSISSLIQILDGGFNFYTSRALPAAGTFDLVSTPNTFTRVLPRVVFTEGRQDNAADPTVGYTTANPVVVAADAVVFVDYNATYQTVNGSRAVLDPNLGNGGVGAIQEVRVLTNGSNYPTAPFTSFSFGSRASLQGVDPTNNPLFLSNGNQTLRFNAAYVRPNITVAPAQLDFTGGNGLGSGYVFVPTVQLDFNNQAVQALGGAATANSISAQSASIFRAFVDANVNNTTTFGEVVRITLDQATPLAPQMPNIGAAGNNFMAGTPFSTVAGSELGLAAIPNRYGNTLQATQTQTSGSGLVGNSYTINYAAVNSLNQTLATWSGGMAVNSNTFLADLTTNQYLAGNEMLVMFNAPQVTTGVGRQYAWGVPVFDNTSTVGNPGTGNQTGLSLKGVRVLNPGVGYSNTAGSTVNFHLVPNPWYSDDSPAGGWNAPTTVTVNGTNYATPNNITAAVSGTVNAANDINALLGYVTTITPFANPNGALAAGVDATVVGNRVNANAALTMPRVPVAVSNATLALAGFPSGSGYVAAPRILVFGGGLDLTQFTGAAGASASTSTGGLIWFTTRLNSVGQVIAATGAQFSTGATAGGTTPTGNVPGNPLAGYVTTTTPVTTPYFYTTNNTLYFGRNAQPAYSIGATTPLVTRVVDDLSEALTRQVNAPINLGAGAGVGGTAIVSPEGRVTSVTFGSTGGDGPHATLQTAYAANFSQVEWASNNIGSSPVTTPGVDQRLVQGPLVFIAPPTTATGVGALAESFVNADPGQGNLYRRIVLIRVTNPTTNSGYGIGNRWQRLNTLANISNPQTVGGQGNGGVIIDGTPQVPGQGAWVYGGSEGNGGLGSTYNTANQDNVRFDIFPGMTYTRDIHYGTGRELD
jgi:hypothetical protein